MPTGPDQLTGLAPQGILSPLAEARDRLRGWNALPPAVFPGLLILLKLLK